MSKKIVLEIVAGLALLCLLVTAIAGVQAYRAPLAQPLSLAIAATDVPTAPAADQPTPPPTVVPAAGKTCGTSGSMNILVIGRDEYFWEPPYGADAIRVVKVDFSQKRVAVFAFPRDLLVQTQHLESIYNIKEYRLGPLYTFVREKEGNVTPEADSKASGAIAQTLYDNFGVVVDHYMTIEESVLPKIVDTVGGVELTVPQAISSPDLTVQAGKQTMNGQTAMLYSRYLQNGLASQDEWGRLDRQAVLFKALAVKLFQPGSLFKAPELYEQVKQSVVTDLSLEQIRTLACMGNEVTADTISADTIAKAQMNILADETMIIKDNELGPVKSKLDSLFVK